MGMPPTTAHWYAVHHGALEGDVIKALVPRGTAWDVCRERYLQEEVDVRRSWRSCLPLLDLACRHGNIRGRDWRQQRAGSGPGLI